jgi:O-acetyl-ADP-ribose deacetylase (regulator of RNase III)
MSLKYQQQVLKRTVDMYNNREIQYIKGDATNPQVMGNKIIVHVCNDIGGWGKGFVLAISNRWKEPELKYRDWHKSGENFLLGEVQFVKVDSGLWVANLIGQHKVKKDENGNAPIRYDAVKAGLSKIRIFAMEHSASVHMPRIGCGLAGGTWDKMEPIIMETLADHDISVYVYDFV